MLEETFSSLDTTWIDFSVNCRFFCNTTGHKILQLWVFFPIHNIKVNALSLQSFFSHSD